MEASFIILFYILCAPLRLSLSQIVTYGTEFEKYQSTSLSSGGQLNCFGLCSCADIQTLTHSSGSNAIQCSGVRSCSLCDDFNCAYLTRGNGFMSLAGNKDVSVRSKIDCWGEAACYAMGSVISTPLLNCDSLNACKDITNYDDSNGDASEIDAVFVAGMFGLQNSVLFSYEDITNTYQFFGWFSGYNTSIYCQVDHTCSIECYQNGCDNLNFYCGIPGTTNEYTNDNTQISSIENCNIACNDAAGHICPNNKNTQTASSSDVDTLLEYDEFDIGFNDIIRKYYLRYYDLTDLYDEQDCMINSD